MAIFANDNSPDIFAAGEQVVEVVLEDYFGNQSLYTATLTVLPNEIPPRILGTRNIEVPVGGIIMYFSGVTAEDAFGKLLEVQLEGRHTVDINTPGMYQVTYVAVDRHGLRTERTINVIVTDPNIDILWIYSRIEEIFTRIMREDMSQVQQARAIFDWVGANVGYAADIRRISVYDGAYQALRNRRGDCFTFWAISELMLTRAGIPNMRVDRIGGRNNHVWNLINPDELGWFHFDATPVRQSQGINRFMFTESEAREFTEIIFGRLGETNYFVYDPELYPEVVWCHECF